MWICHLLQGHPSFGGVFSCCVFWWHTLRCCLIVLPWVGPTCALLSPPHPHTCSTFKAPLLHLHVATFGSYKQASSFSGWPVCRYLLADLDLFFSFAGVRHHGLDSAPFLTVAPLLWAHICLHSSATIMGRWAWALFLRYFRNVLHLSAKLLDAAETMW